MVGDQENTYDSLGLSGIVCIADLRIDSSVILDAASQY